MLIKVKVEVTGQFKEYVFTKNQITIGSSSFCDIVVPSAGIANSHLVVTKIGQYFYVQDQGSSYGSFILSNKLNPGEKYQFATYFPVRIADGISIHLCRSSLKSSEDNSAAA